MTQRVCLDLTPLEMRDRHGGIGRYGLRLLENLLRRPEEEWADLELYVLDRSDSAPRPAQEISIPSLLEPPLVSPRRHRNQRRFLVGRKLRAARVDLFHALHPGSLPRWPGCPVAATSHDIIPVVLPEPGLGGAVMRGLDWLEQRQRHRRPEHLIAISQQTRDDLLRVYHLDPERITVVPQGVDADAFSSCAAPGEREALRARYALPQRWFIYVGSDHYRKNQERLLQAWVKIAPQVEEGLVLVGRALYAGSLDRFEAEARRAGVESRFRWLQTIDDPELPALYRGATALITPSLYEGFGMTILEAMACGTPVAASGVASHPEAGGDAALYFDPLSEAELSAVMVKLAGDAALCERLSRLGSERARSYPWSATAQATLAVYRRLLAQRR